MSIGVVTAFETSRNGKAKVKIDAAWMFAGRCDISGMKTGDRVEYIAEEFGSPGQNGKRPLGLQKWRPVVNGSGQPETASTVTEADELRFVSNVVGSACAAGTIKTPEELQKWVVAARAGLKAAGEVIAPEHEFDDSAQLNGEMPDSFYQGLPPGATSKGPNNPPW